MHELAGHVRTFAKNLADTHESATSTINDMGSVYSGYSYEALVRTWARMSKSHMSELDAACKVIGTALDVAAEVIRGVKIAVLAELAALAATYSATLAATFATGGAAAMLEQMIAAAARKLCQAMEQMLIGYLLTEVMEKAIAPLEPVIDRMVHGFLYDTTADLLDVPNRNTPLYLEPDEITHYADVLDQHADDILRHARDFANKVAALDFTTEGGRHPVVADEVSAPPVSTGPHRPPMADTPAPSHVAQTPPSPRTQVGPWDAARRAGELPATQHAHGAAPERMPAHGVGDAPGRDAAAGQHPGQAQHESKGSHDAARSGGADHPSTSTSQPQATGDRPPVTGDRQQVTASDSGGAQRHPGGEHSVPGPTESGATRHIPGAGSHPPEVTHTAGPGGPGHDPGRIEAPTAPGTTAPETISTESGTAGPDAGSAPGHAATAQASADSGSGGTPETPEAHAAQQLPTRRRSTSKSGRSGDPDSGVPWGRARKSSAGRGTPWKKAPRKATRARVTPPPTTGRRPATPWTGAGGGSDSPKVFAPEADGAAQRPSNERTSSAVPPSRADPEVPGRPDSGDGSAAPERARTQPPTVVAPKSDVIPDAAE